MGHNILETPGVEFCSVKTVLKNILCLDLNLIFIHQLLPVPVHPISCLKQGMIHDSGHTSPVIRVFELPVVVGDRKRAPALLGRGILENYHRFEGV